MKKGIGTSSGDGGPAGGVGMCIGDDAFDGVVDVAMIVGLAVGRFVGGFGGFRVVPLVENDGALVGTGRFEFFLGVDLVPWIVDDVFEGLPGGVGWCLGVPVMIGLLEGVISTLVVVEKLSISPLSSPSRSFSLLLPASLSFSGFKHSTFSAKSQVISSALNANPSGHESAKESSPLQNINDRQLSCFL